jgi:hypothetical protein
LLECFGNAVASCGFSKRWEIDSTACEKFEDVELGFWTSCVDFEEDQVLGSGKTAGRALGIVGAAALEGVTNEGGKTAAGWIVEVDDLDWEEERNVSASRSKSRGGMATAKSISSVCRGYPCAARAVAPMSSRG